MSCGCATTCDRVDEGDTLEVDFTLRDRDRQPADPQGAVTVHIRHKDDAAEDAESVGVVPIQVGLWRATISTEGRRSGRWYGRFFGADPDVAVPFEFVVVAAKV